MLHQAAPDPAHDSSTRQRLAQALHIVVRILIFYASTSLKHYIGLAVISGIYYVFYRALSQLAGAYLQNVWPPG